jgi:transcriptional regulator with GAF, ATPase, and Fis domain
MAPPIATPDAEYWASLALRWASEPSLDAVLGQVVAAALSCIQGAGHAGVSIPKGNKVRPRSASDDLVRAFDECQSAAGEGPAFDAVSGHEPMVRVDELRRDPRWPQFTAAVASVGIGSMISWRLHTPRRTYGVLSVYATHARAFPYEAVRTGTLLAAHASVAAGAAATAENLRTALASRDLIAQAKGILMERHKIPDREAFDLLVTASQYGHRKLTEVAAELTETGELVGMPKKRTDAANSTFTRRSE